MAIARKVTARQGILLDAVDGAALATSTWAYKGHDLFLSAKKQGLHGVRRRDGRLDQEYYAVRIYNERDIDLEIAHSLRCMRCCRSSTHRALLADGNTCRPRGFNGNWQPRKGMPGTVSASGVD